MTVQTTSNLSNSITSVYKNKYLEGVKQVRLYDQLAVPYTDLGGDGKSMDELMRGSTIYVPFLSNMSIGTTAIPETADVTPQSLVDTTSSVTTTSRWGALQWSEKLEIQVYTDYTARAYERVGYNAMQSLEVLAYQTALAGTWVERAAARASLDAGTPTHRASDTMFSKYDGMLQSLEVPGYAEADGGQIWSAIMHPYTFHDIRESGNINSIGQLAQTSIHLNWELGQIGRFRLLVSPFAKVFGAAGADNGSGAWSDLIATAVNPLDKTVVVTNTATNSAYGLFNWLGTEETSTTYYPHNEPVKYISGSTGKTVTFLGGGANGGAKYAHTTSEYMRNADSVYPILFGGPRSMVKVYATNVGEYGMTVGPKVDGLLDQFNELGWKFYGGYAILSENWLIRGEFSTSYEA